MPLQISQVVVMFFLLASRQQCCFGCLTINRSQLAACHVVDVCQPEHVVNFAMGTVSTCDAGVGVVHVAIFGGSAGVICWDIR